MSKKKFELKRLTDYSKPSIIHELRRVAKLLPADKLTITELLKNASVGRSTLRRHFGGVRGALFAAGLERLYDGITVTDKMRKQIARNMTDEEVLSELKQVAAKLRKKHITVKEFNTNARIGADAVRNRFGRSWRNVLRKAGLEVVSHGKRYSDEECYENLLRVWTHYGRPPHYREMNKPPSVVGPKAYIVRWGTWNKALHAFVERVNRDMETDTKVEDTKQKELSLKPGGKKKIPRSERRDVPLGLKFEVFKRDKYRCVMCGRSPATHLNCELQADHIVPFSKCGKTVIENLQTLCRECNLGKGAKSE
jgi:hypothetical protein